MPPAAILAGGLAAGGIGSALGASAGNKVKQIPVAPPSAVNPTLNMQYLGMLSNLTPTAGNTLNNFIQNGYSVLPQWQSMIQAAQAQTQQGQQALNEQLGASGLRNSSVAANADVNYQSQVQSQWLAQLANLQGQSFSQQVQASQYGLGLASGPGTATYQSLVPMVGQNSVLGSGLSSLGSGLSSIGLLKSLGMI